MLNDSSYYFIVFQVAALALFYKAYKERDEILWALSTVLSGSLAFVFYAQANTDFTIVAIFNIGMFLLSIIYFFIDLFANHPFSWLMKFRGK